MAAGPSHGSVRKAWYSWNAFSSSSRSVTFSQASGISISLTWLTERPERTSTSNASSRLAESEPSIATKGRRSPVRFAHRSLFRSLLRAAIQERFARTVLISPLCANIRKGCASGHAGTVLVEYLWWKMTKSLSKNGSFRSQ